MKSVPQAKPPYFEGIFKLRTHEQQELLFLQTFISFANLNLAILCVKRISFFLEILILYEVYKECVPLFLIWKETKKRKLIVNLKKCSFTKKE